MACLLVAAAGTPPVASPQFCADVHEYMVVNGTIPVPAQSHWPYRLCIDVTNLRWARTELTASLPPGFPAAQIFNGTDNYQLFTNASAPGGFTCVRRYIGPDKPTYPPYAFLVLDDDATLNASKVTVDNVSDVALWAHDRTDHPPHEHMEWSLAPDGWSGAAGPPLLRSSCTQPSPDPTIPGMASGIRDFAANFTPTIPSSAFAPPPGLECGFDPKTFKPATDCAPACGAGTTCCQDPASPPPGSQGVTWRVSG